MAKKASIHTSIVAVNTAQRPAVLSNHAVDDDMSRPSVRGTVATGADDLSVVLGVEVLDRDGPAAVELEDLVRGAAGSAADYVRGLACGLLERGGVFADVLPPDVLQGAVVAGKAYRQRWDSGIRIAF